MKKTIALALAIASLTAFPIATPSFAVDTSISEKCGPDAPEAYKRPGGYCDQIGANGSLVENKDCNWDIVSFKLQDLREPIQVADNCYWYVPTVIF